MYNETFYNEEWKISMKEKDSEFHFYNSKFLFIFFFNYSSAVHIQNSIQSYVRQKHFFRWPKTQMLFKTSTFKWEFCKMSNTYILLCLISVEHYNYNCFIFSRSLEYTFVTNHGSVDFFSASSGKNQATPLFSSAFMETASSESASSR